MLFSQLSLKNIQKRKNLIFLVIHIHLLIFAFLGVLWARFKLSKKQNILSSYSLQEKDNRKARVLFEKTPPPEQKNSSP